MDKYIKSISDINLGCCINGGSCSSIYRFGNGLFKLLDVDYWNLDEAINLEFYETISYLSRLEGMPYVVRANDIYRSSDLLFGYSMDMIDASSLATIPDSTLVDDVFSSFITLRKDIYMLSEAGVKTEDISDENLLYNGDMYLIDLDLSLIDRNTNPDELYFRTINGILCGVRTKILGEARFQDKVESSEVDYLLRLKDDCSFGLGRSVKTISDMREGYQKAKVLNKF